LEFAAKFITVMSLGFIELWAAIPAGTALKLHPFLNGLAAGLGAILGTVLAILLGDRLRNWLHKGKKERHNYNSRSYRIWQKYGVIGLGLSSPLLAGASLCALIAISLGASPKRLIFWMSIGIVVWTIIITTISTLGYTVIKLF
jgi:membrane protein YqaA with SNARE-associated domain